MKVAIIGGGAAGLVTAWLLDGHCDAVLFEKNARLGGHAHTIFVPLPGETVPIEIGFEFFNPVLFPYFTQLLTLLSVPIRTFPLTYTFYTSNGKTLLALPPLRNGTFAWNLLLPKNFLMVLQCNYFMHKGKKIVNSANMDITVQQFADSLFLSDSFKNNFLYPFLASGWGESIANFKTFAAYDILKWIDETPTGLRLEIWSEIIGGTSYYIQVVSNQLATTEIKLSTTINSITFDNNLYHITEVDGTVTHCDHLILATNPQEAHHLIQNISQSSKAQSALKKIDYSPTTLAVHGDRTYMPPNESDWSISNVCYDGINSALTIYKPWKSSTPLFRSWIKNYSEKLMPKPLYALEHFHHQKVTPDYFKAQKELKALQGVNNMWFAGHYTHDIDSHESAIVSAMAIAQQLVPQSQRLSDISKLK